MPEPAEIESAIETARQDRAKRNLESLVAYLKERPYFRPSRNDLESLHQDIGMSRNDLRAAITKGLRVDKTLIDAPLPEGEKRGGKQTYIAVAGGNQ